MRTSWFLFSSPHHTFSFSPFIHGFFRVPSATSAYAKSNALALTEDQFVANLKTLLKQKLEAVAREQAKLGSADIINFFGNEWKKWVKSTTFICRLLKYWQGYTMHHVDISEVAYGLWRDIMFGGECKDRIVAAVSTIVGQYRQGVPTNMGLVRTLIDCLLVMEPKGTLVKELGKQYVRVARSFFETQIPVIQAMDPAAAVKFTDDLRIQESKIVVDILLGDTVKKEIETAVLDVLVAQNIEFFLSGFDGIVSCGDVAVGKSIHSLLIAAKKIDALVEHFEEYVKKSVRQVFEENKEDASKNSQMFVSLASEAYGRFHSFVVDAFGDDPEMSGACDKGFKESLNLNGVVDFTAPKGGAGTELSRQIVVPKILADYTHKLMTASKTTPPPSEFDKLQADLVKLVEFLNDKATFIDQYRKSLAQRLLMSTSVGVDRESALLDKLKQINVDAVVTKSQGMLNDIRTSTDFSESFKQNSSGDPKPKYSFDPLLLTSSAWPSNVVGINQKAKFSLPDALRQTVDIFTAYFHRQYPDKKLVHAHRFDKGELVLQTPKRKYYMGASGYQVAVLPLIDETAGATFQALSDKTLLSLDDLKLQLYTAIVHGILLMKGTGADRKNPSTWTADTLLVPNKAFVAKVLRFNITPDKKAKESVMATKGEQAVGKITQEEKDEIIKGRIAMIQAAIVRIMKARKKLGYQELFQQTTEQTSRWFPIDMRTFRKACEDLVDGEYLKRLVEEKAYEYIS